MFLFRYILKFIVGIFLVIIVLIMSIFSEVKVYTDISEYNDYIGINAKEEFKTKWGMDESIFPEKITDEMNVLDYKMVYYNPWDAQYLSYLVVEYDEDEYEEEIKRLSNYNSTDYVGYYGVTGFSKYRLIAMNADEYHGFIYALTDNEKTIIYVELIFCNYFYDINYEKYINKDYLPNGFDATENNKYKSEMMKMNRTGQ